MKSTPNSESTSLRARRACAIVVAVAALLWFISGTPAWAGPTLVSTTSLNGQTVALCFAGPLERASAETASLYAIPGANVWGALLLPDDRTVLLSVDGLAGTTYNVSATGLKDASGDAGNVSGAGAVLGRSVEDLGNLPEPAVAYACDPSALNVRVAGGAIWFDADACNYVSEPRTGDFDVRVQITDVAGGNPNSNLALDVRESNEPGSRHVFGAVYASAQNRWAAARRAETYGPSSVFDGNWGVAWPAGVNFPNVWLRLKRSGNTFTVYGGTDGQNWVQVGDAYTPAEAYPETVQVGLATAVTDAGAPPLSAVYRNFGDFTLSGATIVITSPPADVTVLAYRPATFTVEATVENGPQGVLSFQWQRDGTDIPGATAPSYTLELPTTADSGAQFRAVVSAPGLTPAISAAAKLTVQADTEGPRVVSTAGLAGATVGVCFDETLDETSATDPTRYTINGTATVEWATLLEDRTTVVLQVSTLAGSSFTLGVNGVADLAGNTATLALSGEILGFVVEDLGNLPEPSLVFACHPDRLTVHQSGGAIWFPADNCNYVHQERTGDFDVRVQIARVAGGNAASNLTIDARESVAPDSRHVFLAAYAHVQNAWAAARRVETGGASSVFDGAWLVPWPAGTGFPNVWLRLKRSGGTFTAYGSVNGQDWLQAGAAFTPDPPYPDTIRLGLATAVTDGTGRMQVDYQNFGNFEVTGATIVIHSPPADITVIENRPATFTVDATLENGPQGALSYQWQRDGVDIPGAAGPSYTLALPALADNGAKFRVILSAPGVASATSAEAVLTVLPDNAGPRVVSTYALVPTQVGVCFDEILDAVSASDPSVYSLGAGSVVEAATLLADGQSVVLTVTDLPAPAFTLTVTGIADLKGNQNSDTVAGTNAGVLSFLDVGDVTEPGLVMACGPGPFTVRAGGADIWFLADSFNFLHQAIEGDFDMRLQMTGISGANSATRGGLMVREDETPGSRNVFVGTYAATGDNHWVATYRDQPDGNTFIVPNGYVLREPTFAYPSVWVRLQRTGQTFACFHSADGLNWTPLGSSFTPQTPYPDVVMVGIASSSIFNAGPSPSARFAYDHYGPTPTDVPQPQLAIALAVGEVQLSWPLAAEGFVLQETGQLTPTPTWTAVTVPPETVGDRRQVTVPTAGEAKFYRLAR